MSDPSRPRRAAAGDGLLILGLVGRAGSGKSSVARALVARGAQLLDADRIGHEVTDGDPEVREALLAEYGPAAYLDDGTLNRRLVATMVFSSPAALASLNRLVHPRILSRLREGIAALAAEARPAVVVVDAALMLDWGFERECDAVIAVTAPEESRVARLVAARGWTEAETRRRLDAQKPDTYFTGAADDVIENAGSEAGLADAVDAVLARVRARAAGRA